MTGDWDDDLDRDFDDEWPDDGESDTIACPSCGADIYEDAEQCPVCGEYIVHSAFGRSEGSPPYPWHGKPLWWILLGLAGIVAVVIVLSGIG